MDFFQSLLFVLAAYLLGSIPSAYLVVRWRKGIDIRTVGSRNVGAGNAYRSAGTAAGVLVLVGDLLKGALAVQLPLWLGTAPLLFYLMGIAVVVGHNWSIFLRFDGGKGAATATGISLVVAPSLLLVAGVSALIALALTRNPVASSVIGLVTMLSLIIVTRQPLPIVLLGLSLVLVVLIANLTRTGQSMDVDVARQSVG